MRLALGETRSVFSFVLLIDFLLEGLGTGIFGLILVCEVLVLRRFISSILIIKL